MTSASPSTQLVHPAVLHAMLQARADELASRKAEREETRSRRARARGGRGFIAVFGAVTLLMVGALTALAVHNDQTVFQLDGNSVDDAVGDDWDNIFNNTDSALVTTGIVSDVFSATAGDDQFDLGSKDTDDVSEWHWKSAGSPSDKTDLENAYAALYSQGGKDYLFMGADRVATNGNAKLGFWIFQDDISKNTDGSGTFIGEHKEGDLLVESAYTAGGTELGAINVWIWEDGDGTAGHLSATPITVGADCRADPEPSSDTNVCSVNNDEEITVAWTYQGKKLGNDTPDPSHIFAGGFNETGINLSFYFPDGIPCFSSFLAETRSAGSSVTSSTEDFVLGNFQTCGNIDGHKYLDINGNGALDAGEPALEGWTINLYESDGTTLIDSQVTGSDGNVSFTDLEAGDYVICEELVIDTPPWFNSDPGGSAPFCKNVTLALGGSETRNFGNGQPDIDVTKEASASDVCDGGEVTYTITVTNTGNVDLTNVDVSDDVLGDLLVDGTLAAGASTQFTPSSGPINGTVTNTVTASGDWDGATPAASANASATVTSHDCTITVTKEAADDAVCTGGSTTYDITVTNNSDEFTWSGTVDDDVLGLIDGALVLGPGASQDYLDIPSGALAVDTTNIVTADGTFDDPASSSASDTATATVTVEDCTITLTKTVDDNEVCAGENVTYSYVVHNNSDLFTWTGDITDDNGTPGNLLDDFTVASGVVVGPGLDSATFTHVSAIALGSVTNIATADGNFDDPASTSASDTDTETVTGINCGGGCTPGFWQGGLGVTLWDEDNDADWTAHGGVGTNPFVTTDQFTSFFPASGNSFVDNANMITIVGSGGTNSWPRKAARDLIAAYLNASFGIGYPFSTATIDADWLTAVAGGTAGFQTFHAKYSVANELGCTIT